MLSEGDVVQAKLIEEIEKDHWIVSFQGQLVQVRNTTTIVFQQGLSLNLRLIKIDPIQMQVISKNNNKKVGINIRV